MVRRLLISFFALASLALSSCIENDIPYPYENLYVLGVEVEGAKSVNISTDINKPTVVIDLEETTDIQNVKITSFDYTPEAKVSRDMVGTFDMRNEVTTDLYRYQTYQWRFSATQQIERYVEMQGLLKSTIDQENRTVELEVNDKLDIKSLQITALKLAAEVEDLQYSPTLDALTTNPRDFSGVVYVDVTAHGRTERWTLNVEMKEAVVELEVGAWATIAWLYGSGDTSNDDSKFFYRKKGDLDWIEVAPSKVTGFEFEAKVEGLTPLTEYEFKSSTGGADSDVFSATTEDIVKLPNGSLDSWSKGGKVWYPYLSGDAPWWGSGNEGSTTMSANDNTTTPDKGDAYNPAEGAFARLESIIVASKFAAGSLFAGSFGGLSGSSTGYVKMGRPFTAHPVAIKGRVYYLPKSGVDKSKNEQLQIGDVDEGVVYCALGTWSKEEYGYTAKGDSAVGKIAGDETSPLVIETFNNGSPTAKYKTAFDSKGKDVVAYGEKIFSGYSTEEASAKWEDIYIPLEYLDSDTERGEMRKPTHIIIVCSSSRYGDYFVGAKGSLMYLDDFELVYE